MAKPDHNDWLEARADMMTPRGNTKVDPVLSTKSAKYSQVGGTHYKDMAIQPFEYIHKNNLGYLEGTAVKYVSRWRAKGGIQDLEKAIHAIQFLIETEQQSVKGGA